MDKYHVDDKENKKCKQCGNDLIPEEKKHNLCDRCQDLNQIFKSSNRIAKKIILNLKK